MKIRILLVCFAALWFTACKQKAENNKFQQGPGGLMFMLIEDEEGENIKEDEFVALSYTERTDADSIVTNTNDLDGRPLLMFREKSFFKGDFHEALGMLSEGDSAIFKIRLDSTKIRNGRSDLNKTKGEYLTYHVRVHKVIARNGMEDDQFAQAISAYREEQNQKAKQEEPEKLKRHLAALKTKPTASSSGLNYIINKKGAGVIAKPGDTVEVHYTARYLSGKAIETSDSLVAKNEGIYKPSHLYGSLRLLVAKKYESGFDEALVTFPAGSNVSLIIPSRLAYREDGRGPIKPHTPLLCDLEILRVIPPSGKAVSTRAHVH